MQTCPYHPEAYVFEDIMSDVPVCQPCQRGEPADRTQDDQKEPEDPTNLLLRPREEWTEGTVDRRYKRRDR